KYCFLIWLRRFVTCLSVTTTPRVFAFCSRSSAWTSRFITCALTASYSVVPCFGKARPFCLNESFAWASSRADCCFVMSVPATPATSSDETELDPPPPQAARKAAKSSAEARSIERRKWCLCIEKKRCFCIEKRRLSCSARGQHSIDQIQRRLEFIVP